LLLTKYVITLLAYSVINFDPYSDITAIHRRPLASSQLKLASKQVTVLKTAAPVAAAAASSSVGGTGWTILSIADAWDSSRHVTKFLEGLKNREADREGTPLVPLLLQSPWHSSLILDNIELQPWQHNWWWRSKQCPKRNRLMYCCQSFSQSTTGSQRF
jgi:hypothetical protein